MTPERFQQIEELYHAAREGTAEERAALLAQADLELRRAVESMLGEHPGGEVLDRPAIQNAPDLLDEPTVTQVVVGRSLGPYRIEGMLGEGGMGEVFRAVDTRLGRAVAVKIIRRQFDSRFEREARAISSLNHPHICMLYDVGPNYLVMELVEGETIAARLKSGPLPVKTALLYASQIAAALAGAHAKGITHRDLKPGNIMIAQSGVKVLDFGLAKSGHDETVTASGMILGTPAYMAPEQKEGKPADARSDIYSFGCILHEMLTGVRPSSQRKRMPSRMLERIVGRCLEIDPERRFPSAAELESELRSVTADTGPWKTVGAAAFLLALAAAAYFYFPRAPQQPISKHMIVLADFVNDTGDSTFGDTLRQALAVQLAQSSSLSPVTASRVTETLRLMRKPDDTAVNSKIAREICERLAGAAVLEGSIGKVGSQYVLGMRARVCGSGAVLGEEQAQAAGKEAVLGTLDGIAGRLRARLDQSMAGADPPAAPLMPATTPSLEALKALSTGFRMFVSKGAQEALPHFRRAVELDPQFAYAHGQLALAYYGLSEIRLARENAIKAFGLRPAVSEPERFYIEWIYHRNVTGDLEKAWEAVQAWAQAYPADPLAHGLCGGISSFGTGRFEEALEHSKIAARLDPNIRYGDLNMANAYFHLGRLAEAEEAVNRVFANKFDNAPVHGLRYLLAFRRDDAAGMARAVSEAKGKASVEDLVTHLAALAAAYHGRLRQADELWRRAVQLAELGGKPERAALYAAGAAASHALLGDAAGAQSWSAAARKLSSGREPSYAAGFALEWSGRSALARQTALDLARQFPEDTSVRTNYLPALEGLIAINDGNPKRAIGALEAALSNESGIAAVAFNANYGAMYPAYVRGRALLMLKQPAEAVAEFQKILDHASLVGSDPTGALARWQLGRARALAGDTTKAKKAYQDFLASWKDADPGISVLKQAKAEYANLR